MSVDHRTIETYDKHAKEFATYFRSIKTGRKEDVSKAFELLGSRHSSRVIEVGCGDGRDAKLILEYTQEYTGFDPSIKLLELAQKNLPGVDFVVSDAVGFEYGENVDIVFAFASLIHINMDDMKKVFTKVHNSLNSGGILYLSLKGSDSYHEFIQEGKHGERLFYFYHPSEIREIAQSRFEEVFFKEGFVTNGAKNWFEIALKKI